MVYNRLLKYRFTQFDKGGGRVPVTYEDIKNETYNLFEQERLKHHRQRIITGTPGEIKLKLKWLAEDYKVNEIIAVTITEDFDDRLESYSLLAEQFELKKTV